MSEWKDILEIGPTCHEQFVNLTRAPEIASLDIELAGVSALSGHYQVGRTKPTSHTLFYTLAGQGRVHTPTGSYELDHGCLVILPAHQPFLIEIVSTQWSIVWFNLQDNDKWRALCQAREPVIRISQVQQIYHALSMVYHEEEASLRIKALALVERYLIASLKGDRPLSDDSHRIEQLFNRIENQLHFSWNIANMCEQVHYSAPHFHRLCLAHFGRSPLQQVIYLRIERAKYLIVHTNWSIAQIANHVGYQELFNFSKRFKKSVGQSPKTYRQIHKG